MTLENEIIEGFKFVKIFHDFLLILIKISEFNIHNANFS